MALSTVIPKGRPDHPSLDFELLRAEGITHLENLATELWTDFNAHDPGITLLELLSYAITDLGYRSRKLPIGDLLAGGSEKVFFQPVEILPGAPVTARDYRKLLIDIDGIKNAWVEKQTNPALFSDKVGDYFLNDSGNTYSFKILVKDGKAQTDIIEAVLKDLCPQKKGESNQAYQKRLKDAESTVSDWVTGTTDPESAAQDYTDLAHSIICRYGYIPLTVDVGNITDNTLTLNGLVKVILDLDDDLDPDDEIKIKPIVNRAMNRLQANRSLGQDYVEPPVIVGQLPIAICINIEIEKGKNATAVAAEALWAIEQQLTPTLRFYTFKEMLAKGYGIDEIYNGPLLDHGFLVDPEVDKAQLITQFAYSDLVDAAATVPGVTTVHEFKARVFPDKDFSIQTTYPIFNPGERPFKPIIDLCSSCVFVTQNGVRCEIPESSLKEPLRLKRLLAECYDAPGGPESPAATLRPDLTEYRSLQFDLPHIYGVGDNNPPDDASGAKKGARKQLQAYLAFFDQILAAYLLQLGEVRKLLAVDQDPSGPTYPIADLSGIPGMADIIDTNKPFSIESLATQQDRHNRILDHLLARFGESFSEYVLSLFCSGSSDQLMQENLQGFLQGKADFLRELPGLGSERGKAYNYRNPQVWNTPNVAGIQKRVHRLLGLKGNWETHSLLTKPAYRLDIATARGKQGSIQYQIIFKVLAENLPADTDVPYGGVPLKSSLFISPKIAQDKRDKLYSDIWNPKLYSVGPHPKKTDQSTVLFAVGGDTALYGEPMSDIEAQSLLGFMQSLVSFEPDVDKEGFHVLEHILLRPNDPNDLLLQISLGCDPETATHDPYSSWLTVVAPNWSDKFKDNRFHDHFEQTFRREMPADLAARFCWVDKETMRAFEEAYMAWMIAKASCTPDECHVTAAANVLITWLNETICACSCTDCCTTEPACDNCTDCDEKTN
jgi:hypothetical protein